MRRSCRHPALVLGLGRTGLSARATCDARGSRCAVTDTRAAAARARGAARDSAPDADLRTGGFEPSLLDDAAQVVISPGVSLQRADRCARRARARPRRSSATSSCSRARRSAPVAAITGTNGKSTVTTLRGARWRAPRAGACVAGGNLGEPALDLLERPRAGALRARAVELPARDDALARARGGDGAQRHARSPGPLRARSRTTRAAKARIFDGCDVAVINADDPLVRGDAARRASAVRFVQPASRRGRRLLARATRAAADGSRAAASRCCRVAAMRLAGPAQRGQRARGARAGRGARAAARAGARRRCARSRGLPHRTQWVADVGGVRYVNDSKGTNVGATLAAVAGMAGPLVADRGRRRQGPGLHAAARRRSAARCGTSVLIGRDAPALAAALARRLRARSAPRHARPPCARAARRRAAGRHRAAVAGLRQPRHVPRLRASRRRVRRRGAGASPHERAGATHVLRALDAASRGACALDPVDDRHRARRCC